MCPGGAASEAAQLAPAGAAVPAHLQAALELVRTTAAENTVYRHHEDVVRWSGEPGADASVCQTDCSGLADALLRRAYGLDDERLRSWFHARRPLARHYHAAIKEQHGFQGVATVQAIQPGDFLAVRYEHSEKGENTGHVMLVAAPAAERRAGAPVIAGTRQWSVLVVDQSNSGHGHGDTRRQTDGQKRSGIGSGRLRIYSDAAGHIVGYSWSTSRKSKFQSSENRPLLVGRLEPEFIHSLKTQPAKATSPKAEPVEAAAGEQ